MATVEIEEPYVWNLSPAEYDATVEKIAKINKRAAKRGFTGTLTVTGERIERTRKNDLGFEIHEVIYETTLTGTPPCYNGWSLLASIEWDANAGLIVRTVPGIESIDRSNLEEGKCDHCQINRYRKNAYVVTDGKQTLQVGSTCIKDFLGWNASVVFITAKSVSDDVDEFLSGGSYERDYATLDVLAIAWAAIQVNGWHPASDYAQTTKGTVLDILNPPKGHAREIHEAYDPYISQSYPQALIIRDWVLSDEFKGDSEYVINLKAIARAEYTSTRSIGFLVSAPQAWAKAQERDLIRKAERAEIVNDYIGSIGEKMELTITVKSIRYIDGDYGTTTLYTMVTDDNHMVKWFCSGKDFTKVADDTVWHIKGTIKKHDDYQGTKSTILTRCKVIQ